MRLSRIATTSLLFLCASLCLASSAEKMAKREYELAKQLMQKGQLDAAIPHAQSAAQADPSDVRYLSYSELLKQVRSSRKLADAEALQRSGANAQAQEVLRDALKSDPENPELITEQREVARISLPPLTGVSLDPQGIRFADSKLAPHDGEEKRAFHLRGQSHQVLRDFFRQYGITVLIHSSVVQHQVRFDMEDGTYSTALDALLRLTRSFLVPVSAQQAILYADTQENRREYEHLYVQSFDVRDAGEPQDVNELTNVLRAMFGFQSVAPSDQGRIVLKGTRSQIDSANRFLDDLVHPRAEAVMDVNAYEISGTFLRNIGLNIPLQYQVFNVNTILQQLQNQSPSQLANQLNSSGGLTQASLAALGGLLSSGTSSLASLLNQPIATFGGGITQEAAVVPPLQLNLSDEHDTFRSLRQISLRAGNGLAATYHDGLRYPIVSTQFSPLVNSPLLQQLQNQNLTVPPPEVQYEDLGITLKITPSIQSDKSMELKFELSVRELTSQMMNGVPVISNREFTGSVNIRQGETALLAGFIESSNIRSISGLPGLGLVPGAAPFGGNYNRNRQESELLITITPRVVRLPSEQGATFTVSTGPR